MQPQENVMKRHQKNHRSSKGHLFDDWLKKQLKDPEFKKHYQTEGIKLRIGYRIAELRTKAGLTQADLAKRIGVTQGFIAQLEMANTGNYELKTLKKISEAIGMVLVIGFMNKSELKHRTAPVKELVPC
jgi:ribosome-binding protein aMBF1 (putative translation factor)